VVSRDISLASAADPALRDQRRKQSCWLRGNVGLKAYSTASPKSGKSKTRSLLTCKLGCVNLLAKLRSRFAGRVRATAHNPVPSVLRLVSPGSWGNAPCESGNDVARRVRAPALLSFFLP